MSYSAELDIRVTDSSLRDGSHAIRHQFTVENVRSIVAALDDAGVPVIEVTHGDGLGGSSFNYGFSAVPDQDLISTAVATAKQAKIAFLMLPGVGITDDIRQAADNGASICRIATHCTEADISIQHFKVARSIGLETVGFLMMAHSQPPEVLARQARIMADAGAQCVYVVDSAGSLIMDGVSDRIAALVAELGADAQVGFHGHETLGLGVANSVMAARAGAKQIDGSTRRFGAGAGNTPVEAFAAVTERLGIKTGIAYDREEAYKGLGCVASPIRGGDQVIGAVSVTGPIARIRAHSLVHEVRNTALAIWSGDVVPLPRPLASVR